jgi:hypothetical protein
VFLPPDVHLSLAVSRLSRRGDARPGHGGACAPVAPPLLPASRLSLLFSFLPPTTRCSSCLQRRRGSTCAGSGGPSSSSWHLGSADLRVLALPAAAGSRGGEVERAQEAAQTSVRSSGPFVGT